MNKHEHKRLFTGQAHADERLRDNRVRPIIPFASEAPDMRTCKFIAGEDHYMCGAEALPGKPYCGPHYALTHRPSEGNDAA